MAAPRATHEHASQPEKFDALLAEPSPLQGSVISRDGTRIAFTRVGQGPALIVVDAALCYREMGNGKELARLLSPRFSIYLYDRRGAAKAATPAPMR